MATGCLSSANVPSFAGLDTFAGARFHLSLFHKGKFLGTASEKPYRDVIVAAGQIKALGDVALRGVE